MRSSYIKFMLRFFPDNKSNQILVRYMVIYIYMVIDNLSGLVVRKVQV